MPSINWSNVTDLSQLPQEANNASGGSFWVGMLYMLWIIAMLLMVAWGFEVAIIVSSFLALVLGLMLVYAGLIAWEWCLTFVGIILFMFLYVIWSSKKTKM